MRAQLSITIFFLSFGFQSTKVFASTEEYNEAYKEYLKEKIFTMDKSEWTKGIMSVPKEEHSYWQMLFIAAGYFPTPEKLTVIIYATSYLDFTKQLIV